MRLSKKHSIICLLTLITLLFTIHTALATTYVGSTESDKFHYTDCRWAKTILDENVLYFYSREAAINAGYAPCGTCRP